MCELVTLCAIMRNEGSSLIEWIAHHKVLGFKKIVIYDNESSDGSSYILSLLNEAGEIKSKYWPNIYIDSKKVMNSQESAYNDCLSSCDSEWMMIADADEYFVPLEDESIQAFLSRFDTDVAAIAINWKIFGSSDLLSREKGFVIERFLKSSYIDHPINKHFKTVARVRNTKAFGTHMAVLTKGRYVNCENKNISIINFGISDMPNHDIAQINHYVIKSKQEYQDKKKRGRPGISDTDPAKYAKTTEEFFRVHDLNDDEDRSALQFNEKVRAEYERIKKICIEKGFDPSLFE